MPTVSPAWQQGYDAWQESYAGKPPTAKSLRHRCPYTFFSDEYKDWWDGAEQAEADHANSLEEGQ